MSVTVWGARIMVGIIEPHSPVKNSMCKRWDTPNVCFGGPKRNRLFMAGSQSLYALYVNTQGAAPG